MKFLLTLVFIYLISSFSFSQWERTNGPEGITINTLLTVNDTIYSGTRYYGVYRSVDEGLNWSPANNGIETFEITDLIIRNGILYCGTFGQGVYRSSDGGQSWIPQQSSDPEAITSLAFKEQYLFAGTIDNGVYRSSDGGITWTESLPGLLIAINAMCVSGNKVFASSFGTTYFTTNNGDTWQESAALTTAFIYAFHCSGNEILAGAVDEIYRSTDQGETFTKVVIPFPYDPIPFTIYSILRVNSDIFIGTSFDGVYKSTDDGLTWTVSNLGMGPKDVRALTYTSSVLLAGSNYIGTYRSEDNAVSWNKSISGFPPASTVSRMISEDETVYASTIGDGIYKSSDNGNTWIKITSNNDTINYADVRGMCFEDSTLYIAPRLYLTNTIYKSTDAGANWIRCDNGLPANLGQIRGMTVSGNNVLAATGQGIFYSTDSGLSWTLSVQTDADDVASDGNNVAYSMVGQGGIIKSTNSGVDWFLSSGFLFTWWGISVKGSSVYVGAFEEGCVYTNNSGNSWHQSSGFLPFTSVFDLQPVDNQVVLAATNISSNFVYASTDQGASFSPFSEGLSSNEPVQDFTINDTYMFGGTVWSGVWRRLITDIIPVELATFTAVVQNNSVQLSWSTATETNNAGFEVERKSDEEWKTIGYVEGNGTTTKPQSYFFVDAELAAGEYNYRIKQIDYDGAFKYYDLAETVVVGTPRRYLLEQNYPNPFNPTTKISYSIPVDGNVTIAVYNILGEKIRTLVNEYRQAGIYNVDFNAVDFSSGVYYYTLQADNFVETKKMILIK